MRSHRWTESQLKNAVKKSTSIRQIIHFLGLKEAGGNYKQIKKYLHLYNIDCSTLKGQCWNKGLKGIGKPILKLEEILKKDSYFQSHKLKKRLFLAKLKNECCEICGWAEKAIDGRIPLELDHINGDNKDNRLENLRILCPNCHSLQLTHRGRNKKKT